MYFYRWILTFLLLALVVPVGWAQAGPQDVRTRLLSVLDSFKADTALSATLQIRQSTVSGSKRDATTQHDKLTVGLHSGQAGLEVRVPVAVFEQSRTRNKSGTNNSSSDTSSSLLLDEFSLKTAQAMLDFAPVLHKLIAAGSLKAQKDDVHAGKPAHLLIFDLPMKASTGNSNNIDDFSSKLQVWLGADGVPVAIAMHSSYKVSKFLISFKAYSQRSCELAVIGTRLVCRVRHVEEGGSGMGQSGHSITNSTLIPGTGSE